MTATPPLFVTSISIDTPRLKPLLRAVVRVTFKVGFEANRCENLSRSSKSSNSCCNSLLLLPVALLITIYQLSVYYNGCYNDLSLKP